MVPKAGFRWNPRHSWLSGMTAANLPVISGHIKPSGIMHWAQSSISG
jgi:hypothetical protein